MKETVKNSVKLTYNSHFTLCKALFKPLGLWVHNKSGVTGKRICLEGSIAKRDGFIVVDHLPEFPRKELGYLPLTDVTSLVNSQEPTIELSDDEKCGWAQ